MTKPVSPRRDRAHRVGDRRSAGGLSRRAWPRSSPAPTAPPPGTLIGTLPLSRDDGVVQPFGVKFGGPGLDARQVTDLSRLEPDRLITPNDARVRPHRVPRRRRPAAASVDHHDHRSRWRAQGR